MKKTSLVLAILIWGIKGYSQCNCTITVSSANNNPWVVSNGQTLCITPTGQLNGDILIDGGIVCNEGKIINNYVYITNGGQLNNYSTENTCDSLLVAGLHSRFINSGSFTNERMAAVDSGYIQNLGEGILHCSFFGDSLTLVENEGLFICDSDFYNVTGAEFRNLGKLSINRDFYNAENATIMNNCMIQVERNFYNGGNIFAHVDLPAGCIRVGGDSYNAGSMQLLSFWDSSSPGGNLDYETGTSNLLINPCNASCSVGFQELAKSQLFDIFPNPGESRIMLTGVEKVQGIVIEFQNIFGQTIHREQITSNGDQLLDIHFLDSGMYSILLKENNEVIQFLRFIKN